MTQATTTHRTCGEVDRAVQARDARAQQAIIGALRSVEPRIGFTAATVSRRPFRGEQIAVVECPAMPPARRYAVVTTVRFGFGDLDEQPPAGLTVRVHVWAPLQEALEVATRLELGGASPTPTRDELVEAALVSLAERVQEAVEAEAYTDIPAYVREVKADLLALGVGSQVSR
ncbi:hypothetical protein ACIBSV_47145 [Embleya sp. NPDC050154]|uniref:hypothetical protein n=1 Tax=Embleya sp. NPDC050154 TaxID=3363988 RepID=UPI0037A96E5A